MQKLKDKFKVIRARLTRGHESDEDEDDDGDEEERKAVKELPMEKDDRPKGGIFKGEKQKGHDANITCVVVHDKNMWTGGTDGVICQWDTGSIPARAQLLGHEAAVLAMVYDPRGKLYTASADKTIREWNGSSCSRILRGHTASVTCLALMVNDTSVRESCAYVFSGSADGTMREWHTDWKKGPETKGEAVTMQEWSKKPAHQAHDEMGKNPAFKRVWKIGVWVTAIAVHEMFAKSDDKENAMRDNRTRIYVGTADGFVRIYIYCCMACHPMHSFPVQWEREDFAPKHLRRAITALHVLTLEHAPPINPHVDVEKPRRLKKLPTTMPPQEQLPERPSRARAYPATLSDDFRTTWHAPTEKDPQTGASLSLIHQFHLAKMDADRAKKNPTFITSAAYWENRKKKEGLMDLPNYNGGSPAACNTHFKEFGDFGKSKDPCACQCWPIIDFLYTGTADGAANVQEWQITFLGDLDATDSENPYGMREYDIDVAPLRRFHGHQSAIRALESTIVHSDANHPVLEHKWSRLSWDAREQGGAAYGVEFEEKNESGGGFVTIPINTERCDRRVGSGMCSGRAVCSASCLPVCQSGAGTYVCDEFVTLKGVVCRVILFTLSDDLTCKGWDVTIVPEDKSETVRLEQLYSLSRDKWVPLALTISCYRRL